MLFNYLKLSFRLLARNPFFTFINVFGAELLQVARIILDSMLKQVIIASIIGIPVTYYLVHEYLEKFSERINLELWHYLVPVVILVVIMFITISSVLWKAARANPVDSLRYE
jgi:putative ABC transport system permease protein